MSPKILVVDDDPVARQILYDILHNAGYSVITAESGLAAKLEFTKALSMNEPFQVCFLDILLGDTTGVDLLRTINKQYPNFNTPIVFLSANSKIEVETLHGETTGQYFLEKPFTTETILEVLRRIIPCS